MSVPWRTMRPQGSCPTRLAMIGKTATRRSADGDVLKHAHCENGVTLAVKVSGWELS